MKLDDWKNRNCRSRSYAHFDEKVNLDHIWTYISDPSNITKHSFMPFIHYTAKSIKFNKEKKKKEKTREIFYSSHIDRYIYQYYAYLLNEKYNEFSVLNGIENVSIAYRNNLHKSNIHFAKQAFDFIQSKENCFIVVGDFTAFFDKLSHSYLKRQICNLLNVSILPDDYYAVFRNITKFAWWELSNLLVLSDLPYNRKGIKQLNENRRAISINNFREHKHDQINTNKNNYGIPQGSAISAILSNIYMMSFDKVMSDYVNKYCGLYLRYSDDFIFILPGVDESQIKGHHSYLISEIIKVENLELQPDKTQCFICENGTLASCNQMINKDIQDAKPLLNYLGFTFDGKTIVIRDKTISKYYYRMYRKLHGINRMDPEASIKRKIHIHNLYDTYSKNGARKINKITKRMQGNFLTYVNRSSIIFRDATEIKRSTFRHMQKIRKRLKEGE